MAAARSTPTLHGQDQGTYRGHRWALRWKQEGARHRVWLREGRATRVVYDGSSFNDARSAFIAEQGKHFDEDAERRRRSRSA